MNFIISHVCKSISIDSFLLKNIAYNFIQNINLILSEYSYDLLLVETKVIIKNTSNNDKALNTSFINPNICLKLRISTMRSIIELVRNLLIVLKLIMIKYKIIHFGLL